MSSTVPSGALARRSTARWCRGFCIRTSSTRSRLNGSGTLVSRFVYASFVGWVSETYPTFLLFSLVSSSESTLHVKCQEEFARQLQSSQSLHRAHANCVNRCRRGNTSPEDNLPGIVAAHAGLRPARGRRVLLRSPAGHALHTRQNPPPFVCWPFTLELGKVLS
jgi:hypothetical protein